MRIAVIGTGYVGLVTGACLSDQEVVCVDRNVARIRAYDPEGMEAASAIIEDVEFAPDAYSCATGADALAVVTEWNASRGLDLVRLKGVLRQPAVVDLRNVYRPDETRRLGLGYHSVGRPGAPAPRQAVATE